MAVISLASLPEPPKIRTDGILGSCGNGFDRKRLLEDVFCRDHYMNLNHLSTSYIQISLS